MTEAEWLASDDLDQMLDFLLERSASERKLRLFACACCVPLWPLVKLVNCREAYEAALRFADGVIDASALGAAWTLGAAAQPLFPGPNAAAVAVADPDVIRAVARATKVTADVQARMRSESVMLRAKAAAAAGAPAESKAEAWGKFDNAFQDFRNEVRREQVFYLRCIFGNPFRPVSLDPTLLSWNDGTLVKVARTIYEEKRFDEMPVLADALAEAGCEDEELYGHCRHDWEHFRGCHVLDALLKKS